MPHPHPAQMLEYAESVKVLCVRIVSAMYPAKIGFAPPYSIEFLWLGSKIKDK
jgi:hypothetical protein